MPRKREFSEEQVLRSAMNCFWQHGYVVGVRTLERETGLSAARLYNAYGSKEGLFEQALTRYINKVVVGRVARYLQAEDPLRGLREFCTSACESWDRGRGWGCLLINSIPELTSYNPPVQNALHRGQEIIDDALTEVLRRAQERGQICGSQDPDKLALILSLAFTGLVCRARAGTIGDQQSRAHAMDAIMAVVGAAPNADVKSRKLQ